MAVANPQRRGRGDSEKSLGDLCQFIKGVGPAKAAKLRNLGIENVNDLLTHFPRRFYDRRNLTPISSLQPGVEETFVGRVMTATQRVPRRRRAIVTAAIGDDSGVVQVLWFNQPFLLRHLKTGSQLILSGRLTFYRGQRQVVNPEFEIIGDDLDQALTTGGRIVPVYRLTSGITQRFLRALMMRVLDAYETVIDETLPSEVLGSAMPSRASALREAHFPEGEPSQDAAIERLKLEELFYMQLTLSLMRRQRLQTTRRPRIEVPFDLERRFLEQLPFELTGAQRRVLDDVHRDFAGQDGMNRLLQGDVGSGKTIVAAAALLAGVEAGGQAALMAPTEILALQHFRTLAPYLDALGVRSAALLGSLKAAEKRAVHEGLARGEIQFVVGTHALIQSEVSFRQLSVVVIDEQHRFGVRQRAALVQGETVPHMLVMTATPIPRTLALTAYADLDLSVIDEMPATRAKVSTHIVEPGKREGMYEYIRTQQEAGNQSYLLYPVIEETEKQDLQAAEVAYKELSNGALKGARVGLLHGRMSMADKDRVMTMFSRGDIRVLVTTTVVEVGVHVPQATIMAIHHPERFGLSQLHQLRGRVGRGGEEGYCFLVVGDEVGAETRERLEVLCEHHDGFRIAEEDLRLRGPGEFLGVRQHGVPGFKLANPLRDARLVEVANRAVKSLLDGDPRLQSTDGARCRAHLRHVVSEEIALHGVM